MNSLHNQLVRRGDLEDVAGVIADEEDQFEALLEGDLAIGVLGVLGVGGSGLALVKDDGRNIGDSGIGGWPCCAGARAA